MEALKIARQLSQQNKIEEAQRAYLSIISNTNKTLEKYEAALYFLYTGYQTKFAYLVLISLFQKGLFQEQILQNMMDFSLVPEIEKMEKLYTRNVELLKEYPYIFKKDFVSFDDLSVRYFKIDDSNYIDFSIERDNFGKQFSVNTKQINHYFFSDLSKPIYTEDIYSQYELEYLFDNVRESEHIAKDNHIYLYYSSFEEFSNYLQIIDFSEILKNNKFVFLFEEEKDLYPIDFKERFSIDYSTYPIKNINIKDISKLIWSVQYSAHNGGDFFNEILNDHPNVYCTNRMMYEFEEEIAKYSELDKRRMGMTDKDILVRIVMNDCGVSLDKIDSTSRIMPAIYIQPHFRKIKFELQANNNSIKAISNEINGILKYDFINEFKYIKTFVPLRRFTTSHAATLRFFTNPEVQALDTLPSNALFDRLANKALYVDYTNRSYIDSRVVRFEDGKLNPKATFTALAEFLDIPYTSSMEVCSFRGQLNPESFKGNVVGFDTATVYKTYDEYCDDEERIILEYFYQEAMRKYGYENHYLKSNLTLDELHTLVEKRSKLKELMLEKRIKFERTQCDTEEEAIAKAKEVVDIIYAQHQQILHNAIDLLYPNLPIVNERGNALKLMEPLKLDEKLLKQPLYK